MANFNSEMHLEELEKKGSSVKASAEAVSNAESVIRAADALKEMVEITRRAMRLKREVRTVESPANDMEEYWGDRSPPTPQATEDWDRELNQKLKPYSNQTVRFYSYPTQQKEGRTFNYEPPSLAVPYYRTITSYQTGGQPSRCPCS